jgi:hypothetical protein
MLEDSENPTCKSAYTCYYLIMRWYSLTVSYYCVRILIREPFHSAHKLVTISAFMFFTFEYAGIPIWCHKSKLKEYLLSS